MKYTWTRNDYPPTIYDGKCEDTGERIGGVTHGVVSGDSPAFSTSVGSFYTLGEAQSALIKYYEADRFEWSAKGIMKSLQDEEYREKNKPEAVDCKCDSCGYETKKTIKHGAIGDYRYTCGLCPKCGVGEMPPKNPPQINLTSSPLVGQIFSTQYVGDSVVNVASTMVPKEVLKIMDYKMEENTITMKCGEKEMIKLCANGDIFIRGTLATNDKEVVNGFKEYVLNMKVEKQNKFQDVR